MRIQESNNASLVPTLRVGPHAPDAPRPVRHALETTPLASYGVDGTQSVQTCVPTRSVGTRSGCRNAFTLIELMVAMALTIFVMVILTQAFVLSIDTFSGLKGIGDMQESTRVGGNMFRTDLAMNHFEAGRRPSDPNIGTQPPLAGFIRIFQGGLSNFEGVDGDSIPSSSATNHVLHMACRQRGNQQQSFYVTQILDPVNRSVPPLSLNIQFFNLQTFYNMDPNNAAFPPGLDADATLRNNFSNNNPLIGSQIQPPPNPNFPPVPGPYFYRSQWVEVAYFLVPQGTTEEPLNTAGIGTPLFGLYRVQFVAVTDNTQVNNPLVNGNPFPFPGYVQNPNAPPQWIVNSNYLGMACNPTGPPPLGNNPPPPLFFFTPQDFAVGPASRTFNPIGSAIQFPNANTIPPLRGATLVVPNVLSFQVQGLVQPTVGPGNLQDMFYDSAGGFGSFFSVTQASKVINFNGVFNGIQTGMTVAGNGIPPGTTVTGVQLQPGPVTAVAISNFALANGQNVPITFSPNIPLQGVGITLRVFDNKTRQTRQVTVMQDL